MIISQTKGKYIKDSNKGSSIISTFVTGSIYVLGLYSLFFQNWVRLPFLIPAAFIIMFLCTIIEEPCGVFFSLFKKSTYVFALFVLLSLLISVISFIETPRELGTALTVLEYSMLMCTMIVHQIKCNKHDSIIYFYIICSLLYTIVLLFRPVSLGGNGRYTIAQSMNPNSIGIIISMGLWSILYWYSIKRINGVFVFLFCILFFFAIYLTGSRKAFFVSLFTVIMWFICCYIPDFSRGISVSRLSLIFFIVSATVILALIFLRYIRGTVFWDRIMNSERELESGKRGQYYEFGLEIFRESPIFGQGFGVFASRIGAYSHSTFVEIPISCGIIGSMIYLYAHICGIREIKNDCVDRNMGINNQTMQRRMLYILLCDCFLYMVSIIHVYQIDSYYMYALIFSGMLRDNGRTINSEERL